MDLTCAPGINWPAREAHWADAPLSAFYLSENDLDQPASPDEADPLFEIPFGWDGAPSDTGCLLNEHYLVNEFSTYDAMTKVWDTIAARSDTDGRPHVVSLLCHTYTMDQAPYRERLAAILAMFERFAGGLGVLLIIALLLVMANTIRLAIESRRDEILVIKLVGGTDAFVRRPFLYIGVLYGLLSGVLAWILLALGLAWLNVTVERVASLYQSEFALFGMPFTDGLALVFGSMVLGLAGAWLAVGQHVRAIEPQ